MRNFLLRLENYFKRMPERDQKIFPYFLFVCIFIIFYYGLISPTETKTKKLKSENDTLEQKVFMLKNKVSVLDTIKTGMQKKKEKLKSLEEQFYKLKRRVPEKDEVAGIVKKLAEAEKISYLIREVDERDYIDHQTYIEIPMSVSLQGDYYHIFDFIKRVEDSDRFFLITGMTFMADEEINGNVQSTLNISAFKIRELEYYVRLFQSKNTSSKGAKNGK